MKEGEILKDRIRQLRKELRLNQTDFGSKIGVKQTTVAGYENGAREPLDTVINSICREFNVSEEWLRTGSGSMFLEIDKENQLMMWAARVLRDESDSFKRRFVNMLMSLTEDEWELIERKARELMEDK